MSRATRRPRVFETLEQRQLLATAWQYDFGPTGSPVAPGYTAVAGAAYSAAAGYGWTAGQVDTRDRGPLPGTSALTEDFATTGSASFAVAVPDGTYTVAVTLGDASYAHGPMGVSLQGRQVDAVSTAAGQFAARTYTATVAGGQLVLGLRNLSANPSDQVAIDALTITAVSAGGGSSVSPSISADSTELIGIGDAPIVEWLVAPRPPLVSSKSSLDTSSKATDAAIESLIMESAGDYSKE